MIKYVLQTNIVYRLLLVGEKSWALKIYETKKNVKVGTQTLITYATVIRLPIGNQIGF